MTSTVAMEEFKKHYLYPGTLFVHGDPHLVTTVLGSCVSVCLWDPVGRFGGINHYLLPLWNGEGLATPKYGNIAIGKLIDQMRGRSSNPDKIIAKVFGGASMWEKADGLLAIGKRNIELAEEILSRQRIKIVSSDLGGNRGRKIIFNTRDGSVMLRRQKGLGSDE
ncbi:MAG: chemotaxis protein CheD [Desulfuromonadales bacterium]|nr:chemotaxis protein CheD [Desulfuromonadales bacterium]